ncbi:MAG: SGNH/GDSL hydrolase family protein [Bacteroidota bacterium]
MKSVVYFSLLAVGILLLNFTFPVKKKRVIFLGDSITAAATEPGGYITLLSGMLDNAGKGNDFDLIGAGIGGNRVPDLQKRLQKDVLAKKPDLVFIYIGVNDVWHFILPDTNGKGTPKDQYEAGLNDLIKKIQKAGAKVVLCTPAAIGEKHRGDNAQDAMLDEYSDISRKVAKDNHIPLCDLRKAFMSYLQDNNTDNVEKGILTFDGVHLSPSGNNFVAGQMMTYLLQL